MGLKGVCVGLYFVFGFGLGEGGGGGVGGGCYGDGDGVDWLMEVEWLLWWIW